MRKPSILFYLAQCIEFLDERYDRSSFLTRTLILSVFVRFRHTRVRRFPTLAEKRCVCYHRRPTQAGAVDFTAPDNLLIAGQNVLAVRGKDRGDVTFLDVQVTAESGALPNDQQRVNSQCHCNVGQPIDTRSGNYWTGVTDITTQGWRCSASGCGA